MEKLLALAIQIAAKAHIDQFDKGGNPYILHPLWVMNQVKHLGIKYMIVAVLHDVIEDSNLTIDNLRQLDFTSEILAALMLLDFRGKDYDEQIKSIYHNPIARAIKLKDLEHNSRITRLKGLRQKDFARLEKYSRSYIYLKN